LYIRFALNLLESGDAAVIARVAEIKGFISAIFKLMKEDNLEVCGVWGLTGMCMSQICCTALFERAPFTLRHFFIFPKTIQSVLGTLRSRVLANEHVSKTVKVQLLNNAALDQV
jgi:hypothetical protein